MQYIFPGGIAAQAIYTATKLRIADLLAEKQSTAEELAQATACDSRSLYRVLCALTSLGIFEKTSTGAFRSSRESSMSAAGTEPCYMPSCPVLHK
jgi:hypothetical protein